MARRPRRRSGQAAQGPEQRGTGGRSGGPRPRRESSAQLVGPPHQKTGSTDTQSSRSKSVFGELVKYHKTSSYISKVFIATDAVIRNAAAALVSSFLYCSECSSIVFFYICYCYIIRVFFRHLASNSRPIVA